MSQDEKTQTAVEKCFAWCEDHLSGLYHISQQTPTDFTIRCEHYASIKDFDLTYFPYKIVSKTDSFSITMPKLNSIENIPKILNNAQFIKTTNFNFNLLRKHVIKNISLGCIDNLQPQLIELCGYDSITLTSCDNDYVSDLQNYSKFITSSLNIGIRKHRIKNIIACLQFRNIHRIFLIHDDLGYGVYTSEQLMKMQILITTYQRMSYPEEYSMDLAVDLIDYGFENEC